MGTRKKLVLASLVSVMMVFAFVIGFVPTHDSESTGAGAGGRIAMVDLLDMILGQECDLQVVLSSRVEGVWVKTPIDNSAIPQIPVPVSAEVTGTGAASADVTFVANVDGDPNTFVSVDACAGEWTGDQNATSLEVTGPVTFPWSSGVDVSPFITGLADTVQTLAVYSLVNAVENEKAITLSYQAANSALTNPIRLTLNEVVGTVDNDNNALPDNIFTDVGPGQIWIANVLLNGQLRTILVANLDQGDASKQTGTVYVSPDADIAVEAPDTDSLVAAGLVDAGQTALVIVELADTLQTMVDAVDGDNSWAARNGWANDVLAKAPGALTGLGQFVEISLLYTYLDGSTLLYDEIEDLSSTGLNVTLSISNLDPGNAKPQLWSFPSTVADNAGQVYITNEPGDNNWKLVYGETAAGDTNIVATFDTLSIFAPLDSGMVITGATPNALPQGFTQALTLSGFFPVQAGLNVAAAEAAYQVLVGGEVAAFRAGSLAPKQTGVAMTADTIYVTAPALESVGAADVQVLDLANTNIQATAAGLVNVIGTAAVTASVDPAAAGTIALAETGGGDGFDLPEGNYALGTQVQAALTYDPLTYTFDGWTVNGVDVGDANPLLFNVDAPTALVAHLSIIAIDEWTLDLSATAGGTVVADPAAPGPYATGTVVALTATANDDCNFTGWGGLNGADVVDPENDGTGTITMDADKVVVAQFVCGECNALQLSAIPGGGGTVAVTTAQNCPGGWLPDTVITIVATPNLVDEFRFLNFGGASAGDLTNISDPDTETGAVTANLVMDGNKIIIANFITRTTVTGFVLLDGEVGAEAWIFGGVVRKITGTGLTNDTPIFVDGVQIQGFRAAADYTSIDIVIPPYAGSSLAATVAVDITAGVGSEAFTLPNALTYKRHELKDGVNTTAFIVANPMVETTVAMTLDGTEGSTTSVVLPALNPPTGVNRVFGIARNAVAMPETKANTESIGALGTGYISSLVAAGDIPAGSSINNAYDFSLHLYAESEVKANTPPAGSGSYATASGLLDFGRPVDPDGNPDPAAASAVVTLPLDASALTYADVRKGLTMWGVGTAFDYVTETTTVLNPPTVAYQSELENDEVNPALTTATPDTGHPDTMIARLYTLNGFSLRSGALLTEEMQEGVKLFRKSGDNWFGFGTANGDIDGGTELKVVSPMGGIAWVDRIEFRSVAKATVATAKAANFTTVPGSDEYNLVLKTPKASAAGITDMVIFLKADPNTAAVTLERAFEYKKAAFPLDAIILILLGLLIAGIGLLAGGDSGGGGGGPCFIATAAYGTPLAGGIDTLRAVRDEYLLSNAAGTAFVDAYYQVSPAIADVVAKSPVLAALVRVLLVPVIFLGKVALAMPMLTAIVGISLGAACLLIRRKARGRA
ncbi:MAG TPA: hypothetical protein PLI09_27345 [Candidatus Hydrogenedentes bacterium]|nr:hypothetical protein [Candidatus Hydrogenedentota bacterium]